MNARRAIFALGLLALVVAGPAFAHDQSYSYVDVTLGKDGGDVRLSVHRDDAAAVLGIARPADIASDADAGRLAPALERILSPRFTVTADGRGAAIDWSAVHFRPERRAIEFAGRAHWRGRPGEIAVDARLFPDNPLHETFVNVYAGGRLLRQDVLSATHASVHTFTGGAEGFAAVMRTFVALGIHHIFTGPDHILFVIALLLLGGGVMRILKITTAFTLAHSITLALAVLGVFAPPARVIEPLIALSIVWVAVQNLRQPDGRGADARAPIAFAFGLVHGFGFAGALTTMGLPRAALGVSLFAFNVGVEIGQACIVLTVLPLLALLRAQRPALAPRAVTAMSWGVALAGGFWFVQRIVAAG